MTDDEQIAEYMDDIGAMGGEIPFVGEDPTPMQIAKLQDVWHKLLSQ